MGHLIPPTSQKDLVLHVPISWNSLSIDLHIYSALSHFIKVSAQISFC
jgi:hypothetical protein